MPGVRYASVPNLVIAWIGSLTGLTVPLAAHGVSTDLPPNYGASLPFVRVTNVGGSRRLGIERARIRVECFANKYDDAETLANDLAGRFETDFPGFTNGHAYGIAATTNVSAAWTAWDDQTVTRFMATYDVAAQSR